MMRAICLTFVLLFGASTFAQEQALVKFDFLLPFPERTYSGEWEMRLELAALDLEPSSILIKGFGPSGQFLFEEELGALAIRDITTWTLAPAKQELVQSISLQSDQPLAGVLWLTNLVRGQINGVRLIEESSATLRMPHVAQNYFKWKSSFSLVGESELDASSSIFLNYLNSSGRFGETVQVTEQLRPHAYFRRTPLHDLITDETPEMGLIEAETEGFAMSGYATYSRVEDSLQTCALELTADGSASGVVLFTGNSPVPHDNFFVFSNFSEQAATVELTLRYTESLDDQLDVLTVSESLSLPAFSKRIRVLGSDLFADYKGLPLSMSYQSNGELGEDVSISAIHLQSGLDDQALAGSHFSLSGERLNTWMTANGASTQEFQFGNFGEAEAVFKISLYAQSGETWSNRFALVPGNVVSISSQHLINFLSFDEALTDLPVFMTVQGVQLAEGDPKAMLAGKLTTYGKNDFATIAIDGMPAPQSSD